ncbi:MAG: HAD-IIIA family hydrolase [Actinomycetota bacterium]|nr:HAD-IIIA family hydrolase [Actinomycetota bacterium]
MTTGAGASAARYDVVIPTSGRSSLRALLEALEAGSGPRPGRVIVVDDRRRRDDELALGQPGSWLADRLSVLAGPGRGPAAARNAGWQAASGDWVAFLDDDVVPEARWALKLAEDLAVDSSVAASQGQVIVPLPPGRRPTDWERNVAGLQTAVWATADMAYRRSVLSAVGGFDERFPRAYREDADLGLRVVAGGWSIVKGTRRVSHPVRPAPVRVSLSKQAGNADDVLMSALHGRDWRMRAGAPPGRRVRHLAATAAAVAAVGFNAARRPRSAAVAGLLWGAATAELAWARIAPGPRDRTEIATMAWTSAAMPFAATGWWLVGWARLRRNLADTARAPHGELRADLTPAARRGPDECPAAGRNLLDPPEAVFFDRDGTLVVDVPYNGDPDQVQLVPGARAALLKLRNAGIATAVVSNQSGVARGLISSEQVDAVNARIEELLGPLGPWAWCPHGPEDGCDCRKPRPGLVLRAAHELGVDPRRVAVVGDIGADMEAARAAGARSVLVPTPTTRAEEVQAAPVVAADLEAAVDLLLAGRA